MLYTSIKLFPKKDQYTLGIRLETLTLEILELVLLSRMKTGLSKVLLLKKADLRLKILKLLVRASHEVRALPQSRYIILEEKLLEIGKMLGGWLKKLNTKPTDNTVGL